MSYKDPETRRLKHAAYYQAHLVEVRAAASAWAIANPRRRYANELRRKYSLTIDQFDAMLIAQDGRCAICNDPMVEPHVDHDHETKKVRGLLDAHCNRGIGCFKDDPEVVASAMEYLRRHHD